MNTASLIGIIVGIAAIVGGNLLEGGKLTSVLQPTAAFIVFGGTLGATLLSFPLTDIIKALSSLRDVFMGHWIKPDIFIKDLVHYADISRKKGLIALEAELPKLDDPFFRKALTLAIDRMHGKALKEVMDQENMTFESERKRIARVFETAGGFAPTVGILGAVLGLINVMENLSDPSRLGSGIAVAFVATIYGVGSANLILLPISKKLINKLNHDLSVREMILEGVLGIQAGLNPYYLQERLHVHLEGQGLADKLAVSAKKKKTA